MRGGLVLRLKPHEKVLVNGVLIENGARRAQFRIKTQDASILRVRDAIPPDEATTPARRLYYIAQLAVLGEAEPEETTRALKEGLGELRSVFGDAIRSEALERAFVEAEAGRFFRVMRLLNQVLPLEDALLSAPVASSQAAS